MSFAPLTGAALAAATAPLTLPRRIESARLTLCMFREDHFEALARMHGDPDTMRFMGGPRDINQSWRGMAMMLGQWEMLGYGAYAVEAQGQFVGRCGLYHPLDWPERELGYCFLSEARGEGYATEAATAVRDAAIAAGARRLISLINPANAPSLRLAARMGATRTDQGDVGEGPMIRFVHDMRPPAGGDITGAEGVKPKPKTATKTPRKRT